MYLDEDEDYFIEQLINMHNIDSDDFFDFLIPFSKKLIDFLNQEKEKGEIASISIDYILSRIGRQAKEYLYARYENKGREIEKEKEGQYVH